MTRRRQLLNKITLILYILAPIVVVLLSNVSWLEAQWKRLPPLTAGTAIIKGDGSGGFTNAVSGVDYALPGGTGMVGANNLNELTNPNIAWNNLAIHGQGVPNQPLLGAVGSYPSGQRCDTGQTCYYVAAAPGGNDANIGTDPAHPWLTVSKAASVLSTIPAGGKILFHGGDTWTNQMMPLGDVAGHAVTNGTATSPILIGTYGPGKAIFDEANNQFFCFAATLTNANPAPFTVKYLTIDNFECEHAFAQGVVFNAGASGMLGITVQNMYIHNTGPACSQTTGPCTPVQEVPFDWQSAHAYTANSTSNYGIILPTAGNAGQFWFMETVASCTSGGSAPTWPQTPGNTVSDGSGTPCSWTNLGTAGNQFLNQLHFTDSSQTVGDGVHFIHNVVKWGGGHNLLEVQGDHGAVLIADNVVGPGGVHGDIDTHNSGSAATPMHISGNVAGCGYSQGMCGCENTNSIGNNTCLSAQTPSYYIDNAPGTIGPAVIYQNNVAYDVGMGFEFCQQGTPGVVSLKLYNNTVYVSPNIPGSYGIYAACGSPPNGSLIDLRNNIFDGGSSFSVAVTGGSSWATAIEDYNDIGGAQGNPNFSFNGVTSPNTHDLTNKDPIYLDAGANPPDFTLSSASPVLGAGLGGLTANTTNMGAY